MFMVPISDFRQTEEDSSAVAMEPYAYSEKVMLTLQMTESKWAMRSENIFISCAGTSNALEFTLERQLSG